MCGLPVLDYDVGARMNAVQFARVFTPDEQDQLLVGPAWLAVGCLSGKGR